jgi:hypothetical protein
MSSSKSVRFSEISWEVGESKRSGEKNGADPFLILVRDEDREIKSKEQNKRLLTTISPVLIVNKHYTHKGDAHPYERVEEAISEALEEDAENLDEHQTVEKGHGRQESRTYAIVAAPEGIDPEKLWRDLSAVGIAISERVDSQGRASMETRYYILSRLITVQEFAAAVRGHWGIEIPQSDGPRSDNLCVAGRAGYHRRGGPAHAGLMG